MVRSFWRKRSEVYQKHSQDLFSRWKTPWKPVFPFFDQKCRSTPMTCFSGPGYSERFQSSFRQADWIFGGSWSEFFDGNTLKLSETLTKGISKVLITLERQHAKTDNYVYSSKFEDRIAGFCSVRKLLWKKSPISAQSPAFDCPFFAQDLQKIWFHPVRTPRTSGFLLFSR